MFLIVWLLALIGPRVALFFTWLFTSWVDRAFDGILIPVLGFFMLPWTTLAYVLIWRADGLGLLGWLVVALGLFADFSSYASSSLRST